MAQHNFLLFDKKKTQTNKQVYYKFLSLSHTHTHSFNRSFWFIWYHLESDWCDWNKIETLNWILSLSQMVKCRLFDWRAEFNFSSLHKIVTMLWCVPIFFQFGRVGIFFSSSHLKWFTFEYWFWFVFFCFTTNAHQYRFRTAQDF